MKQVTGGVAFLMVLVALLAGIYLSPLGTAYGEDTVQIPAGGINNSSYSGGNVQNQVVKVNVVVNCCCQCPCPEGQSSAPATVTYETPGTTTTTTTTETPGTTTETGKSNEVTTLPEADIVHQLLGVETFPQNPNNPAEVDSDPASEEVDVVGGAQ